MDIIYYLTYTIIKIQHFSTLHVYLALHVYLVLTHFPPCTFNRPCTFIRHTRVSRSILIMFIEHLQKKWIDQANDCTKTFSSFIFSLLLPLIAQVIIVIITILIILVIIFIIEISTAVLDIAIGILIIVIVPGWRRLRDPIPRIKRCFSRFSIVLIVIIIIFPIIGITTWRWIVTWRTITETGIWIFCHIFNVLSILITVWTKIVYTASGEDNHCPHCYRCGLYVKHVEKIDSIIFKAKILLLGQKSSLEISAVIMQKAFFPH